MTDSMDDLSDSLSAVDIASFSSDLEGVGDSLDSFSVEDLTTDLDDITSSLGDVSTSEYIAGMQIFDDYIQEIKDIKLEGLIPSRSPSPSPSPSNHTECDASSLESMTLSLGMAMMSPSCGGAWAPVLTNIYAGLNVTDTAVQQAARGSCGPCLEGLTTITEAAVNASSRCGRLPPGTQTLSDLLTSWNAVFANASQWCAAQHSNHSSNDSGAPAESNARHVYLHGFTTIRHMSTGHFAHNVSGDFELLLLGTVNGLMGGANSSADVARHSNLSDVLLLDVRPDMTESAAAVSTRVEYAVQLHLTQAAASQSMPPLWIQPHGLNQFARELAERSNAAYHDVTAGRMQWAWAHISQPLDDAGVASDTALTASAGCGQASVLKPPSRGGVQDSTVHTTLPASHVQELHASWWDNGHSLPQLHVMLS
jgi:hypothetical protein